MPAPQQFMGQGGASSGGDAPAGPKVLARLRLPKGFDLGDTQPGDTLDVTAHCQLSEDAKYLEVLKVDGAEGGADDDDDAMPDADAPDPTQPGDDAGSTPGDRWEKHFGAAKRRN